jgi:hypothetical protein
VVTYWATYASVSDLPRTPMPRLEVAREAIREYVEQHSREDLLGRVLDEEIPRYAEALRRLGE